MANVSKSNEFEKIYTPENLISHLCDLLDEYKTRDITQFIEPSAGSGHGRGDDLWRGGGQHDATGEFVD